MQRQLNVLVSLVMLYLAGPSARYSCASPAIAGAKSFEPVQARLSKSSFEYRLCVPRFAASREFQCADARWLPENSPVDPSDTMLSHYLIAKWAKF